MDRDTAEVIAVLTDTTDVLERLDEYETEGEYDMCQAMDAMEVPEEDRDRYRSKKLMYAPIGKHFSIFFFSLLVYHNSYIKFIVSVL